MHKASGFVRDDSALDLDGSAFQINFVPGQGQDLRAAEAAERQQGGNFIFGAVNSFHEDRDLLRIQELARVRYDLGEADGIAAAGLLANDGSDEAPGILEGLCADGLGFLVDDALPSGLIECVDRTVHGGGKAVLLDGTVAPDGSWGENVPAGFNVAVDGSGERRLGRAVDGLQKILLDGHGPGDAGFLGRLRDRDPLAPNAKLDKPVTRRKLTRCGDFDGFHMGLLAILGPM